MKSVHFFYFFCLIIFVNGNCLLAEPKFDANIIASFVSKILKHSPEVVAAKAELEKFSGVKKQAGLFPNPVFGIEYEKFAGNRKFAGTSQIESGVKLGQTFVTAGKLRKAVKVASIDEQIAVEQIKLTRRMVQVRVFEKLVELDALVKDAGLAKEILEVISRYSEAVTKKEKAGEIPAIEKMRARIKVSSAKTRLSKIQREIMQKKREIVAESGRADFPAMSLKFPEFDQKLCELVPENFKSIIDAHPEIAAARLEKSKAETVIKLELAKRTPNFELEVGFVKERNQRQHFYTAGIRFELPVFDRKQGNFSSAKAEFQKRLNRLSATELKVRNALLELIEDLESAGDEKMQMLEFILPEAELMLSQAVKSQSYGESDFLKVLDARMALLEAKQIYYRICADELCLFFKILTEYSEESEVYSVLSHAGKGDI